MTVQSSYGIYNNVTDDIEFTENVKMNYLENVLFSEKVNFFNVKNELLIEGNIKTKSPKGELQADRLDFDLNSKKLKISMDSNEKVNIKVNY
jgi:lipopolysaccharide assembly outer membrane protein LptD (OstA)